MRPYLITENFGELQMVVGYIAVYKEAKVSVLKDADEQRFLCVQIRFGVGEKTYLTKISEQEAEEVVDGTISIGEIFKKNGMYYVKTYGFSKHYCEAYNLEDFPEWMNEVSISWRRE